MKHIFLTANEKLDSGLLQSQLVKPVETYFGRDAMLINIHRPFANRFKTDRLRVLNLPFLVPFRFINFRPVFFLNELVCFFYSLVIGFRLFFSIGRATFVCRGYVPGLVGWWLNRLLGVRFIFDPRSLYVHEHVGAGNLREGSMNKRYWLWVERRVVHEAAGIVCVSEGMAMYYSELGVCDSGKMIMIPCFGGGKAYCDGSDRLRVRSEVGFSESDMVIAYFGSLNTGWNNLEMYREFFEAVGQRGAKILVISQDAAALRKTDLKEIPYVRIVGGKSTSDQEKAVAFLDSADYGLVLMEKVPDWKTRLSVKFAEYTCRGLPVIVGKYVGEASRLVNAFNLEPSVVTDGNVNELELRKATAEEREQIRLWATRYFAQRNILRLLDVSTMTKR